MATRTSRRNSRQQQKRPSVRVAVIDDQLVFRLGLRTYLEEAMPDLKFVAEAASAEEGLTLVAKTKPDLVLLDAAIKDRAASEVLTEIKRIAPEAKVVLLANVPGPNDFALALESAADGYLLKTISPDRLISGLREVIDGNLWIQPELGRRFYAETLRARAAGPHLPETIQPLTPRQFDILQLVAQGLRNAEIAERLCISEQTVKTHIANLLRRLGVKSRLQAAQYAMRMGLVDI